MWTQSKPAIDRVPTKGAQRVSAEVITEAYPSMNQLSSVLTGFPESR
jgi:hypothetical protein